MWRVTARVRTSTCEEVFVKDDTGRFGPNGEQSVRPPCLLGIRPSVASRATAGRRRSCVRPCSHVSGYHRLCAAQHAPTRSRAFAGPSSRHHAPEWDVHLDASTRPSPAGKEPLNRCPADPASPSRLIDPDRRLPRRQGSEKRPITPPRPQPASAGAAASARRRQDERRVPRRVRRTTAHKAPGPRAMSGPWQRTSLP